MIGTCTCTCDCCRRCHRRTYDQGEPTWRFAGRLNGQAYIVGIGRQMSPILPLKEPMRR